MTAPYFNHFEHPPVMLDGSTARNMRRLRAAAKVIEAAGLCASVFIAFYMLILP